MYIFKRINSGKHVYLIPTTFCNSLEDAKWKFPYLCLELLCRVFHNKAVSKNIGFRKSTGEIKNSIWGQQKALFIWVNHVLVHVSKPHLVFTKEQLQVNMLYEIKGVTPEVFRNIQRHVQLCLEVIGNHISNICCDNIISITYRYKM